MVNILGVDRDSYLGLPISDIFVATGVVNNDPKAMELIAAQFGSIKIVPADLDGSTTVEQIYEHICKRIGQPLNGFCSSDIEP